MNTISTKDIERMLRHASLVSEQQLRPESQERIKNVLLSEFARVTTTEGGRYTVGGEQRAHRFPWLFATLHPAVPVIAIVLLFVALGGTAVASDRAIPGDLLYGIDRALEKVQVKLVDSNTEGKLKVSLSLAEEREQEQLKIEAQPAAEEHIRAVLQAEQHTEQALNNATEVIERVRIEQQEKGNEQATQSLTEVSQRLAELQQRHEERKLNGLRIEIVISGSEAVVDVKCHSSTESFTLPLADVDAIVTALSQRFGIDEDTTREVMKVSTEADITQGNSNAPKDENPGESTNTSAQSSEDSSSNPNIPSNPLPVIKGVQDHPQEKTDDDGLIVTNSSGENILPNQVKDDDKHK